MHMAKKSASKECMLKRSSEMWMYKGIHNEYLISLNTYLKSQSAPGDENSSVNKAELLHELYKH